MSIGLIDSGIGGLTTLCDCIKAFPDKDYIYIADTLNAPYGSKDKRFLIERAYDLVNLLVKMGAETVVFACNSCSTTTLNEKNISSVPLVRVLPQVDKALEETKGKVILLATPVTMNSDTIKAQNSERLIKVPNNILATLVERNAPDFFKIENYLKDILLPYKECESIILGCTHYLFLTDIIKKILPEIKIYHSNESVVEEITNLNLSCRKDEGKIHFIHTGLSTIDYENIIKNLLNKQKYKHNLLI